MPQSTIAALYGKLYVFKKLPNYFPFSSCQTKCQTFLKWLYHFILPLTKYQRYRLFTSLPAFGFVTVLNSAGLTGGSWYLTVVLVCPYECWTWMLFHVLTYHPHIPLGEMYPLSFVHFLTGLFAFISLSDKSSLYALDASPYHLVFSPFKRFHRAKVLILMQSSFFFYVSCFWCYVWELFTNS